MYIFESIFSIEGVSSIGIKSVRTCNEVESKKRVSPWANVER